MKFWILAFALAGGLFANDLDDHYAQLKDAQTKKDPDTVKKLAWKFGEAGESRSGAAPAIRRRRGRGLEAARGIRQGGGSLCGVRSGVDGYRHHRPGQDGGAGGCADRSQPQEPVPDPVFGLPIWRRWQSRERKRNWPRLKSFSPPIANNEDALDVLATGYSSSSPDRAERLRHAPADGDEGQGQARRRHRCGLGKDAKRQCSATATYIAGAAACTKSSWIDCDRNLKAALPYVSKEPRTLGITYYYLGLADYQIGKLTGDRTKIQEGEKYSEKSSAIAGPFQAGAYKNAQAMKQELAAPRR